MKRGRVAFRWGPALLFAAAIAVVPGAAAARPDRALEAQLRAHIEVLAADDFQGREPGTEGEARTLAYLAREWANVGLVSGTNEPGNEWFAPVTLVERSPEVSSGQFSRRNNRQYVPAESLLVLTSGRRSLVRNAPVLFVGNGASVPPRNELAGKVALLLDGGLDNGDRQNALLAGGASAVLTVLDGDRRLENVAARRRRSGYALAGDATGGDLEAFISKYGFERLMQGGGQTLAALQQAAARPNFAPLLLDLNASFEATTRETTIRTYNLIGKLPGKRPAAGAVLFMAHWDHFGRCGQPPAEDLVCNGAVDNASGVAVLTEVARRLVARQAARSRHLLPCDHRRGTRPARRPCLCRKPAAAAQADRRGIQHR